MGMGGSTGGEIAPIYFRTSKPANRFSLEMIGEKLALLANESSGDSARKLQTEQNTRHPGHVAMTYREGALEIKLAYCLRDSIPEVVYLIYAKGLPSNYKRLGDLATQLGILPTEKGTIRFGSS